MNAIGHGVAPAAECVGVACEARIGAIILGLDLASSHARSGAEAAWRGEIEPLESDLRRLREQVVAVITNFKEDEASALRLATEERHEPFR